MNRENFNQTVVVQTIDGVDALVNTDPGEVFIDLPASNPRYIRVREGDHIQEGDVRTRTPAEMSGPRLTKWRIESISTETVTGTNANTGETREWERDWLVQRLGAGEFSAELTTFDRVSVTEIDEWRERHSVEEIDEVKPYVIAIAYGNNGEKFTSLYAATEAGDWDSLELVQQDESVQNFSGALRERFDEAVHRTLEVEQRYH